MKSTRIQPDTLEDNLICDDLFFEYFSTFLSLPCFPSRVCYNRLTGGIELIEAEDNYADENPVISVQWPYDRDRPSLAVRSNNAVGYTEERRQRMISWTAEDRLPLFLRSPLYREFKLCRHLLKAVDYSKPRSGRVRGYSLDTDAVSSLTTAAKSHSNGGDAEDSSSGRGGAADDWFRQLASAYRHMRPSSQAISLPPKLEYPGFSRYIDSDGNGNGRESPGGSFKSTHGGSSHRFSQDLVSHPSDAAAGKPRSAASSSSTSSAKTSASDSNQKRLSGHQGHHKHSDKHYDDSTSQGSYYNRVVSAPSKVGKSSTSISEASNEDDDDALDDEDADDEEDDDEGDGDDDDDGDGQSGRKTYLVENAHGEHRRTSKEATAAVSVLERKHGRSMQEIKEQLIGNLTGMQSFRAFLEGTLGAKLYDFWLEAERFRDEYEPVADQDEKKRQRQLYRNILDLYGSLLTEEVRTELHQLFNDSEIDRTTLARPQYGALRRLRAYWLPRFILHRERLGLLSSELSSNSRLSTLRRASYTPLSFPTLTLGSWVCSLHSIGFWSLQSGSSRPPSRTSVKSAEMFSPASNGSGAASLTSNGMEPSLRDKLISALMYESLGGGPLTRFARRDRRRVLLNALQFNRDVAELSSLVTCLRNDRMLRRERYWSIYNKYIVPDSAKSSIECPPQVAAKVHAALSLGDSNSFVLKPAVFAEAQLLTIDKIMPHWLDFLKTDALTSLTAICTIDTRRDPTTGPTDRKLRLDDADFIMDDSMLVVKLKKWIRRYVGETPVGAVTPSSASALRRNLEDSLWDAASQARWRKWLADQRRSADRLRREAIKAANARLAEQKREAEHAHRMKRIVKPKVVVRHDREDTEVSQLDRLVENKTLLGLFRRAVDSVPDVADLLGVYSAIVQFSREEPGSKRDQQAVYIYKQYLDQSSANRINLETLIEQPELRHSLMSGLMMDDATRPPSPALNDLKKLLANKFAMDVQNFLKKQSEQLGLEATTLIAMSPDALKQRYRQARADQAVAKQREGRMRRGEANAGKAPATRDDRTELMQLLTSAAYGPLPRRLVAFRRYVCYFSDIDKMANLENDLLFCIEAIRFKTACHPDQDEQWLKRKLSAIVDVYMDAVTHPSCQIDISSEMNDRSVKSLRRAAVTLEFSPILLEEILNSVLNTQIYQYYAGFRRVLSENPDTEQSVLSQPTRKEKTLIQRHRQFEDFQQPPPRRVARLPPVPEKALQQNNGIVFSLHFSLADGAAWKRHHHEEGFGDSRRSVSVRNQVENKSKLTSEFAGEGEGGSGGGGPGHGAHHIASHA